ncbi:class D beta-lactamase [Flavobacterium sp.]|uniref:class D beta-lactamase n=1 Tax=Flavobacterium sp. TaxID=239 RepID=UPI003D13D299
MKKIILLISIFFLLIPAANSQSKKKNLRNEIVVSEFDTILDSLNVKGAILIFDSDKKTYYSNNFNWAKAGHLPASTFKVPNSIIALETGVVKNETDILKWNGEKRARKNWEQDLTFKQAFQLSCLPCYQEIARKIGVDRMNFYLKKLNYNTMVFDSSTIDNFWIQGKSHISQFQQIAFLEKLQSSKLPISKKTESIIKEIMEIEKTDDYVLRGKTGWSITNEVNNGWLVGYIEKNKSIYFFATNLEPKTEMVDFGSTRINATKEAFKKLKVIKQED